MESLNLSNLSPASVDPNEIVDRDADAQWLSRGLQAWFRGPDPSIGGAYCLLGDKGIGKSILTRHVIEQLRQVHAATTLFLLVDCRPLRSQRDVYREATSQLVDQLAPRQSLLPAILAEARSFDALTRFDTVSLRHAHEQLTQFKASLDLGGSESLAKWLDTKLGISLARTRKTIETLEGSITIDGARLYEGFVQLMHDISRHTDLHVVLYLDNVEELNHEALRQEHQREAVRADIEALLHLSEAPLALVLNMRTYYASVLPRRISKRRNLGPMPAEELRVIFEKRLQKETAENRARARQDLVVHAIDTLATMARTPLAFLTWVEYVLDEGRYDEADLRAVLSTRLASHYVGLERSIPKVAALFQGHGDPVAAEKILDVIDKSESIYRQLIDQQVILPHNYWDPREFYLDPELDFLLAPDPD